MFDFSFRESKDFQLLLELTIKSIGTFTLQRCLIQCPAPMVNPEYHELSSEFPS